MGYLYLLDVNIIGQAEIVNKAIAAKHKPTWWARKHIKALGLQLCVEPEMSIVLFKGFIKVETFGRSERQ